MASPNRIKLIDLAKNRPYQFDLVTTQDDLAIIASHIGAVQLNKMRFTGDLTPLGKHGWRLTADIGATLVQACVVTGAPVTTRIDDTVERRFDANVFRGIEPGSELEMPEDDSVDPLPEILDLIEVASESLVLLMPDYPRAEDATITRAEFAAPGTTPMTDEMARPFAGLAGLRDQLADKDTNND